MMGFRQMEKIFAATFMSNGSYQCFKIHIHVGIVPTKEGRVVSGGNQST